MLKHFSHFLLILHLSHKHTHTSCGTAEMWSLMAKKKEKQQETLISASSSFLFMRKCAELIHSCTFSGVKVRKLCGWVSGYTEMCWWGWTSHFLSPSIILYETTSSTRPHTSRNTHIAQRWGYVSMATGPFLLKVK